MNRALFYLSNHEDNIYSVKFFDENNLLSSCNCGLVTLWDLCKIKSIINFKVSNYSALYSNFFNNDKFFVKTKEGSLKIWDMNYDKCVTKLNTNNFTFAKPYSLNNQLVTPINHNGDIAICDINIKQNTSFNKDAFINDEFYNFNNIPLSNRSEVNDNNTFNKSDNNTFNKSDNNPFNKSDNNSFNKSDNNTFNKSDNKIYNNFNDYILTPGKTNTFNKLVISFKEIKKKIKNIEILSNKEDKDYEKFLNNNLNMFNEIIDIYPLKYFGETFILVCYEPSLFCIYDYRMTNNLISSFMLDMNKNVLSFNINNNNCIISTNNNFMYYLSFDKNQKIQLKKVVCNEYNNNQVVIRPDDQIFLSISNNSTINIYELNKIKLIDHISSYKFNHFNFLDFHNLSGFFAAAENSKISIWSNYANNFNSIKNN
ncbi:conserved Plasmodium protein, unknown function [Plasmodium gallinaceum]|uniref:Uncharacterized protein n=1 Tax=Plasmodium gallinaceum TaxID=5849 RepID=A0A1J1GNN0_PLAGA|nr:conserved Plasmodium protein, unknown function [Plasmodium gallinaceum]CRG94005.1 conserved Plasmodium protein, unknown function [Plasmodium gallinaceum]